MHFYRMMIRVSLTLMAIVGLYGCGGLGGTPNPPAANGIGQGVLTSAEVQGVVQRAAQSINSNMSIAVSDRTGRLLAVFRKFGANPSSINARKQLVPNDDDETAAGLARTAAFFSHNQAPLSSRTVRFISGAHFPPGVSNAANAPLYGIENTNRGAPTPPGLDVLFPAPVSIDGTRPSKGIVTGKTDVMDSDPTAVNPGGVPIYKGGQMAGGVGIAGVRPDLAEFAAMTGATSPDGTLAATPNPLPSPGAVFVDGVRLPFVEQTTRPSDAAPGNFNGSFLLASRDGTLAAERFLLGPTGSAELTVGEVQTIIDRCVEVANRTRAVIRLPVGARARFAIAVGDLNGNILGLFRMTDSTIFSLDVAITKARNVVYFSNANRDPNDLPGVPPGIAVTNRTINFGAQPFYPPGIDNSSPGPFFNLFQFDTNSPFTEGNNPRPTNKSGVVFFAGAVPLYKNGTLVGGLGVSGDGVDQDDYVAAGGDPNGHPGFAPPANLRADQFFVRGVRLPYLKFPRNPEN